MRKLGAGNGLKLCVRTFQLDNRRRRAVRLLGVVACVCVLVIIPPPVRRYAKSVFAKCHDGNMKDLFSGDLVPDYFGDNFTVYKHSHNNRKCPPLPLRVPPRASLFQCDWYDRPPMECTYRLRARLLCDETRADIVYEWVELGTPPSLYQYHDPCVARVLAERCTENGSVPRPCLVLFHADYLPYGSHWEALLQLVPHVIHINRSAPAAIFGHVMNVVEHKADVARLEAMRKFGGVYADMDHILLKPLQGLLHHDVVMGTEEKDGFGNGFFLGKPKAKFLDLWYDSYKTFDDSQWGEHSVLKPREIYNEHVTRNTTLGVHVVDSFFRPNWCEATELYENRYDWTNLYGVHLYHNRNKKFFTNRLDKQESSLGEVTRHVLFGWSEHCLDGQTLLPVRMGVTEN